MFKRLLKLIMAFKAKNLVVNEKVASSKGGATSTTTTVSMDLPIVLSNTEAKILLESLKNTSFKGEMVEVVYILALKLKTHIDNV
tara:strand:+ start:287 stop:541 length:255 start_codon:yes stop_codon:yes gene_type:complete